MTLSVILVGVPLQEFERLKQAVSRQFQTVLDRPEMWVSTMFSVSNRRQRFADGGLNVMHGCDQMHGGLAQFFGRHFALCHRLLIGHPGGSSSRGYHCN